MEDQTIKIGKYNVKVVRDACIGAASCVAVSPDTFLLDNDKKAVIKDDSKAAEENILMAAQSCPTAAIIITNTETGEQVWPN